MFGNKVEYHMSGGIRRRGLIYQFGDGNKIGHFLYFDPHRPVGNYMYIPYGGKWFSDATVDFTPVTYSYREFSYDPYGTGRETITLKGYEPKSNKISQYLGSDTKFLLLVPYIGSIGPTYRGSYSWELYSINPEGPRITDVGDISSNGHLIPWIYLLWDSDFSQLTIRDNPPGFGLVYSSCIYFTTPVGDLNGHFQATDIRDRHMITPESITPDPPEVSCAIGGLHLDSRLAPWTGMYPNPVQRILGSTRDALVILDKYQFT